MSKPIQPIYILVGAKIAHMREALGWNQADLARRIGLTRASVANIETGRQRILLHDVETIARAFQTNARHFIKGIW